jgi:glycosyltransferase involved in cell wall biosynthesis
MLENKKIAIVIPLYNEAENIGKLLYSLPNYLDEVIIVNDGSKDNSDRIVHDCIQEQQNRLEFQKTSYHYLAHTENRGKGAAIKTGYFFSLNLDVELVATIDGDGQMCKLPLKQNCLKVE